MLIRDAYPDEFSEVGELRLAAYRADGFISPDSAYATHLRELGADGLGRVLVAIDDARDPILGTVMLQTWPDAGHVVQGPGEGEIRALAVRPDARGAGIGRALLAAVIDRASRMGVSHLVLCTQPEMRAAHHLYEEAGFSRLPERDWFPEPAEPLLAYGKRLREPRGQGAAPGPAADQSAKVDAVGDPGSERT